MPAATTVTQPEEYTPVYWDGGDLPPPEGLYGKAIHDSKLPQIVVYNIQCQQSDSSSL
jgi:hypothetical protein